MDEADLTRTAVLNKESCWRYN